MFGLDYGEILVIAIVALVVIGPKDLPRVLRQVGQWVGKGRAMARHFRTGIDSMIREAELDEMNKQWAAQNAQIMEQHAAQPAAMIDAEAIADQEYAAAGGAASPEQRAELFGQDSHFTTPGGLEPPPAVADPPMIPAPHLAPPEVEAAPPALPKAS